jgi:RNA polymerase sigma-70 factor (ECF subfamily)
MRQDGEGDAGGQTGRACTRRPQHRNGMMEDRILIDRCRQGDELAWEHLVRRYQGRVCSVAYTYTGSEEEALDVAQEVFVRVWKRLDSCRDPERFAAWLLRIARNACLDQLRRRRARPPAQDLPADEMHDLAAANERPDADLERDDQRHVLEVALQRLSPINREAILLKDIQGLPLEEMADMLDLPLGTVKSRCSRARVELARVVSGMIGSGPEPEVAP